MIDKDVLYKAITEVERAAERLEEQTLLHYKGMSDTQRRKIAERKAECQRVSSILNRIVAEAFHY